MLDADGCVVAPGLVDLQVHFREPGDEEAETIETGARAAALGGFTAVVAHAEHRPAARRRRGRAARCSPRGAAPACATCVSSGCITKGRARRAARADGRAVRPRRAHLHRRRRLRRRRGGDARARSSTRRRCPGAVLAQHAEDPDARRAAGTCTKARGRPARDPGPARGGRGGDRRPRPRARASSPAAACTSSTCRPRAPVELVRAAKARGRAGHRRGARRTTSCSPTRAARASTRCSR